MKLSARNQIRGKVVAVQKGQTTAHVRIDIGNGVVITSSITNEAIDDLGLAVGDEGDCRDQGVGRDGCEVAATTMISRPIVGIVVSLLLMVSAVAQTPMLSLEGKVKQPQHWTLDDLKKMQADHADVTYQTDRGPVTAHFSGVLLWSLIAAGGIDDDSKGAELHHAIRITAKDGYVVVTSTGEIAPDFGGKAVLVAYERDDKRLDGFRIVMPGDKHGGRNVRDVTTIEVE
jgi:molybdopterin-binding protein